MIRGSDRYWVALFGMALSGALLWIAVPSGISLAPAVSGNSAMASFYRGSNLAPEVLDRAAAGRERALLRYESSAFRADLSALYFVLWRVHDMPAGTPDSLRRATEATGRSLRARPLQARDWWRASVLSHDLAGRPTRRSAELLLRSVELQPNAMNLLPHRLRTVVDHWDVFTDGERRSLAGQFAAAFTAHPWEVGVLARDLRTRTIVRAQLALSPEILGRFEVRLQRDAEERARR